MDDLEGYYLSRLRLVELPLLGLAVAIAAAGLAALALLRLQPVVPELWPVALLLMVFLAAHVSLTVRRPGADQVLLPLAAVLCGLGLLVIDRTKPDLLPRQAAWLAIGLALFLAVVFGGDIFGWLRRYRYTWALLGLGLLAVTLVFGKDPNDSGVRIWIGIGGYLFQPAELVKVLMVAFFAAYLDEHRELLSLGIYRVGPLRLPPLPYLAPSLVMLGLSLLLFLVQHDLGVTFLFFGVFVAMLYAVSGRGIYVLSGLGVLAGASYLVYHLFSVARLRMDLWRNPWVDPQGRGYQIIQALVAFASGGILGTGPGHGAPGLIPAAYTDFPFAVLGEELGLVGGLAVVAIYLIFTIRGFRIALDLGDDFRGLLAMGLATTLGLQALIILAGNLKLVPLTGITLPFVSYGGSSLITNFVILGLLLRLSAEAPPERGGNHRDTESTETRQETSGPIVSSGSPWWRTPRRVGAILIAGFLVVALDLAYWHVLEAPALAGNMQYNAYRLTADERNTQRGRILDRNGQVIASTEVTPAGVKRVYAYPALADVVGYHDAIYGNSGLEAAFDGYLSGRAGVGLVGRVRTRALHEPTVGADVVLTIDLDLQKAADQALGDGPGAIVVLDPRTGEVLAMASHPYFDPNTLQRDWPKLRDAPDHPLLNRATQGLYTPGSVFKTVSLAAALDLGYYTPATRFTCNDQVVVEGYPIKCDDWVKGTFDMSYAYAYSCNACFAEVGLRLGGRELTEYARRFGFESTIPLEIAAEPSQIAGSDPEKIVGPLLASTAFGQGQLLATPLQMAVVAAAVADGGVAQTPHLVQQVRSADGAVLYSSSAHPWRTVVRPETAKTVVDMMVRGVEDGFASPAKIAGVKVGGKTGTAEVGGGQNSHAWFIGIAPADTPRLAIAVVKEHGGGGGTVATPMGRQVLEAGLKRN